MKTIKSRFLTYFNPIGSTKEQQIKAWKELKWKPEEEKLTDFVFRFSQLAHELAYTDEQQIAHFVLCIPRGLYLYLEGAKTVPDAVENLRKGIALGGLDTFNSASASKTTDDSKPSVPFMAVKEYRPKVTTEDTLRVVKESIHDSVYESSRSMIKQLDKIGDKLANVVEDFQKKQSSRSSRNRDRSNSRDRNDSRDRYRNKTEVEIEVETEVEIEAEIEEIAETIVETEEDQTQEKVETTNRDLVQVKDTLTKRISVTTAIEQVIQHIGVSNLKTI